MVDKLIYDLNSANDGTYFLMTHITTREDDFPILEDLSAFIYDFNLLYELNRLIFDEKYRHVELSRRIYYRRGRKVEHKDKLRILKLSHESPFEIITIVTISGAAIAAILATIQTVEKISNMRLQRENIRLQNEKARLEIEKLEYEIRKLEIEVPKRWFKKIIIRREAEEYLNRMERMFTNTPIFLEDYSLDVVDKKSITEKTFEIRKKKGTE